MPRETFKKIITSPETWEQVNKKNKRLMEQFLREKNTRSSDTTINGYESDLKIFFTWNLLNNEDKFFIDIKKLELAEFFSYVTNELRWGSARFSRMRSVLSSLSIFIERYLDDDYPNFKNLILKAIENMPKNTVREKTILTQEQLNKLFEYLENSKNYQISCWLALAISSGSRFSELLRFTTDNIDENHIAFDGIFLETLKPIKTKGRTKTGKLLVKYIIKETFWKHYQEWLIERQKIMDKNSKTHTSIFIKINGDPAEESTVRGWVEKIEKFLEIPFYPHATRHFYTTYLAKTGLPYELIKDIVGWDSTLMCQLYDDVQAKDKKWSELNNLKESLNNK
jgi:integrase